MAELENNMGELNPDGQERPSDLLIPLRQGGGPIATDVIQRLARSTAVHAVKTRDEAV